MNHSNPSQEPPESVMDTERVTFQIDIDLLERVDALRWELGCRSRGTVINRLLRELLIDFADSQSENSK